MRGGGFKAVCLDRFDIEIYADSEEEVITNAIYALRYALENDLHMENFEVEETSTPGTLVAYQKVCEQLHAS